MLLAHEVAFKAVWGDVHHFETDRSVSSQKRIANLPPPSSVVKFFLSSFVSLTEMTQKVTILEAALVELAPTAGRGKREVLPANDELAT